MAKQGVFCAAQLLMLLVGTLLFASINADPHTTNSNVQPAEQLPVDEIEDMDKIFETYERQYLTNDPWSTDQLLVQPSPDSMDSHIITSRASQLDTFEGSGEAQAIPPTDLESNVSDSVTTVRTVVDEFATAQKVVQNPGVAQTNETEPENRTIVVVVTTNVYNAGADKGSAEKNQEQHDQLSFGLADLVPSTSSTPQMDLHNRATTEFFNAGLPKERTELEEGTFELLAEDPFVPAGKLGAIIFNATSEQADIDPIVILTKPTDTQIEYEQPGVDTILVASNMPTINKNDHIPDAIESIPHAEVREKFLADIPKEANIDTKIYSGLPPSMSHFDDTSGYVVEEAEDPYAGREADAVLIDVDNVVPEKCKVVIDDIVYGTKDCDNDTYSHPRNSRQLGDLTDDELTVAERAVIEPARRGVDYDLYRSIIPRINRTLTNYTFYEDMRFVSYLHTYLAQYTGRSYMEDEELAFIVRSLLSRKHELETVTVSSLRDMSEYIEKTTYFNFPNSTARLPEYVLTGDRVKDQKRLDRLVYNRRFAAELWSRGRQPEDKAKISAGTIDLSMVSIQPVSIVNFDRVVERVSTVLGDTNKEVLAYRKDAGTNKEKDNIFFVDDETAKDDGDTTDPWQQDYVPWFDMTPEERRDVEFAAYLHSVIDTSAGILPRIAYYIHPKEKLGEEQPIRDSRSLVSAQEPVGEAKTTFAYIASDGHPGIVLRSENVENQGIVRQDILFDVPANETTSLDDITPEPESVNNANGISTETVPAIEVIQSKNAESDQNVELSNEFLLLNASNTKSVDHNPQNDVDKADPILVDGSTIDGPPESSTNTKSELLAQDSLLLAQNNAGQINEPSLSTLPVTHSKTVTISSNKVVDESEGSGGAPNNPIETTNVEAKSEVVVPTSAIQESPQKNAAPDADTSSGESHEFGRMESQRAIDDDTSGEQDASPGGDLLRSVVEAVELSHDLDRALETFRDDSTESSVVRQTRSEDFSIGTPNALVADYDDDDDGVGIADLGVAAGMTRLDKDMMGQDPHHGHHSHVHNYTVHPMFKSNFTFTPRPTTKMPKHLGPDLADTRERSFGLDAINTVTFKVAFGSVMCFGGIVMVLLGVLYVRKMASIQRQFLLTV